MPITVACPCGKQLRAKDNYAGKRSKCPDCGNVLTIPRPDNLSTDSETEPVNESQRGAGWRLWAGVAAANLLIVIGGGVFFTKYQRDLANREVVDKVRAAKEAAQRQQWDEAIGILQDAKKVDKATELGEANRFMEEVEESKAKQQAERLLTSAEGAIGRGDVSGALRLLNQYQGNPHSAKRDKAKRLADEIELATSIPKAVELLSQLPDEEFSKFQAKGELAGRSRVENAVLRRIYVTTLEEVLPLASARREEIHQRQEAERLAAAERQRLEEEAEQRKKEAGEEIRRFRAGADSIKAVAYSQDGRFVAAVSNARLVNTAPHIQHPDYGDTAVYVWEASTGKLLHRFSPEPIDRIFYSFSAVSLSPNGKYVAASREDGTVRIWELSTGQVARVFEGVKQQPGASDHVNSLAFSPDGKHILTCGNSYEHDKSPDSYYPVRLWDVQSGQQLRVLSGHSQQVRSVAFSPNGRYAVSGGYDRIVILWDLYSGREVRVMDEHEKGVTCVAFSPDGRHVLSGGADGKVILWDGSTGKSVHTINLSGFPETVSFSLDGRRALVGLALAAEAIILSGDNPTLLDLEKGESIELPATFRGTTLGTVTATFSPDGRRALYSQPETERVRGNNIRVHYLLLKGLP